MTLAFMLFAAGWQGSNYQQEARFPPMPVPSAYDAFENAAPLVIGEDALRAYAPLYLTGSKTQPRDIADAVERSADALPLLRPGLKMGYQQPITALQTYPEPFAKNQQTLGRLLLASGDRRYLRGEIKEALADYTDLLRYGNLLVNAGNGTSPMVGLNMMEHARGSLWMLRTKMSYLQAANTAAQLKQFAVSQRPYTALLGMEERMFIFRIKEIAKKPLFLFSVYNAVGIDPFHAPNDLPPEPLKHLTRSQLNDDVKSFFDGWIDRCSRPFAHRGRQPTYEQVASKRDEFLAYLVHHGIMAAPCNDLFWYAFLRNQASNGLAACAFATYAFQLKSPNLPTAFSDFGPNLLASLPPDPFRQGALIQADFEPHQAIFRSVGGGPSLGPELSAAPGSHARASDELANPGPLVWRVPANER